MSRNHSYPTYEYNKSGNICGVIKYSFYKGFFWVRLFGIGLHIKDIRTHPLLFSERYGHSKYIQIGSYRIRYLNYNRHIKVKQ